MSCYKKEVVMEKQTIAYPSLDTPAVLLDMDKLEANIREMSQIAAEAGIRLRPHIKVHESAVIAKLQIEAGACGVEVGTVAQAEAMSENGINDILVAHPVYGHHKLEALKRLLNKPDLKITVALDMIEQAEAISQLGQKVPVLLVINVGADLGGFSRFGVSPGEPAVNVAKKLCQLPGIEFTGIYTHEMPEDDTAEGMDKNAFGAASLMAETTKMLRKEGIGVEHVSVGASNTFHATCRYIKDGKFPEITEIHPGHRVIGDIMYMRALSTTRDACAVTVLTSVMSTSRSHMAIIDAGYKTFGKDSLIESREKPGFFWEGMPSFGSIQGHTDLWLGGIAAESGFVYYQDPNKKLRLGDRLEIVPNNATLVINIHDRLYGVRNGSVEMEIPIAGRGRGN